MVLDLKRNPVTVAWQIDYILGNFGAKLFWVVYILLIRFGILIAVENIKVEILNISRHHFMLKMLQYWWRLQLLYLLIIM